MTISERDQFELLVIGAGYWGMSAFKRALSTGVDAGLVDGRHGLAATSSSMALVKPERLDRESPEAVALPDDSDFDDLEREFEWLVEAGELVETRFVTVDIDADVERDGGPVWMLPDDARLMTLTSISPHRSRFGPRVTDIEENADGYRVRLDNGDTLWAQRIIAAVGSWLTTCPIARDADVDLTFAAGRGLVFDSLGPLAHKLDHPLIVEVDSHRVTMRRQFGAFRAGSTWEDVPSPARAEKLPRLDSTAAGRAIYRAVEFVAEQHIILGETTGIRPISEKPVVRNVARNFVLATGGGAAGLALAGLISAKSLELVGI